MKEYRNQGSMHPTTLDTDLRNRLSNYLKPYNEQLYKLLGVNYNWEVNNQIDFYSKYMKTGALDNPKNAVGGMWDEIGQLQFKFLEDQGLKPHHKLLDYGCGSLRGGLHFIEYLDMGNYCGVDISPEILKAGRKFLTELNLDNKQPDLKVNSDLLLEDFPGKVFDFVIAQSVLTHMPLNDIKELFDNIHKVMNKDSVFFATFFEDQEISVSKDNTTFYYPFEVLKEIAGQNGLDAVIMSEFVHPRNQKMIKFTVRRA